MRNISDLEIKIYPLILESPLVATHLWHLIRAIDEQGSGKVSFTKNELKDILGVSKSSIYRYMNSELFDVVSHTNKNKEKVYTFYYRSLKQVKVLINKKYQELSLESLKEDSEESTSLYNKIKDYRLENLITASFCFWSDIKSFMVKRRTATEVIAESIQARSYYIARNNKKDNQHLLNIDKVFVEDFSTSDNTQGVKRNAFGIFYDRESFAPYGSSQQTIAKVIKRSRQTVNKRLKNKLKVQQFVKGDLTKLNYAAQQFYDAEEYTNVISSKYFVSYGSIYERYTNLYYPIFTLKQKAISFKEGIICQLCGNEPTSTT